MHSRLCIAAVLVLAALAGCARGRGTPGPGIAHEAGSGPQLIVTPEYSIEGKIASVNSNLQFVVVTFPVGTMPALGQRLSVYRHGLKTGEIKISGPRQDDSIVGDLIAGDAAGGDVVRGN